jgi:heme-degrading monooxygenase HmoA
MIVRIWRGRAAPTNPHAYAEHFTQRVLPELKAIAGFLGAALLREDRPDGIEFLVLTRWESMDAVRAFAGDDVTKAVIEPRAMAALVDFDASVRHFTVVEEAAGASRS